MTQGASTAFFSYCREDSEFALKLAEDLKLAGAHVWIDQLDIEPGTPWDRAVEEALNNAPRMLVVLSPVSANSDNVRDEVSFALSRQKRVIPVLYRDCEIPFRLARLQHIDFRPNYERALKILLRALGVGEAEHLPAAIASAGAAAEPAVATSDAGQERAQKQKLEEERKLAAEKALLEQQDRERKAAEEKARQEKLEEERRLAAERARLEEERKVAAEQQRQAEEAARQQQEERERVEADARARQEQSRREQRAAEQARLEAEARRAGERARLAQEEQVRRAAEIQARQDQLRREQQESVERERLDLGRLEQEQRELDAAAQVGLTAQAPVETERRHAERAQLDEAGTQAAEPARQAQDTVAAHRMRVAPPAILEPQPGSRNFASSIYLIVGAILLIVLGLTVFLVTQRGGQKKAAESKVAGSKAAETAGVLQPQSSASNPPATVNSSPAGTATPADSAPQKDQGKAQPAPSATDTKEPGKAKPLAKSKGDDLGLVTNPNTTKTTPLPEGKAAPEPVRISQGVSQGWLIHQVKPDYPPLARQARVQGEVVLNVVISKTGTIKSIAAETGHPMLIPAAIDAVKQWRYKPYRLDGKPVEVDTQVLVNFTLTNLKDLPASQSRPRP